MALLAWCMRWHRRRGHNTKNYNTTDDIFGQILSGGKSTLVCTVSRDTYVVRDTTDSKLFNIYIGKLKLIKLILVSVSCLVFHRVLSLPLTADCTKFSYRVRYLCLRNILLIKFRCDVRLSDCRHTSSSTARARNCQMSPSTYSIFCLLSFE